MVTVATETAKTKKTMNKTTAAASRFVFFHPIGLVFFLLVVNNRSRSHPGVCFSRRAGVNAALWERS